MKVNFFMVGPTPVTRYSRSDRSWTAFNDDLRIVAGGRTKKEAIANFTTAWQHRLAWEVERALKQSDAARAV